MVLDLCWRLDCMLQGKCGGRGWWVWRWNRRWCRLQMAGQSLWWDLLLLLFNACWHRSALEERICHVGGKAASINPAAYWLVCLRQSKRHAAKAPSIRQLYALQGQTEPVNGCVLDQRLRCASKPVAVLPRSDAECIRVTNQRLSATSSGLSGEALAVSACSSLLADEPRKNDGT